MSVDLSKGATVELVKTLSDDLRTKNDGTKYSSAGAGMRLLEAGVKSAKNASLINEETAFANPLAFSDGADDVPVKDCVIDIQPSQSLNGYDHPWAGGTSINLLPNNATDETKTSAGVTVTAKNGVYTLSGTSSAGASLIFPLKTSVDLSPSTNKIAFLNSKDIGAVNVQFCRETTPVHYWSMNELNRVASGWTASADETIDTIIIGISAGTDVSGMVISPMLMKTSEADPTTFTPYSNICPISGWTEAEIKRMGYNRFDINDMIPQTHYNTDGVLETQTYRCSTPLIPVEGTLALKWSTTLTVSTYAIVCQFDGSKNLIYRSIPTPTDNWFVFALQASTKYVGISFYSLSGNINGTLYDVLVAQGSDNTYEPYTGTTYSVDLSSAGTVYGGTLDVTTGVLTVDTAKLVLDGTEVWQAYNDQGAYTRVNAIAKTNDYVGRLICDKLRVFKNNYVTAYKESAYGITAWGDTTGTGQNYIYIKTGDVNVTDAQAVKTWVTNNPVTVVYELATPQTYQLTPTEVTTLLKNNTLTANCGDIKLSYYADAKSYIDNAIATAVASL